MIEYKLLNQYRENFRQKIITLKKPGYKTKSASTIALGLKGNPYDSLMKYEDK